MTDDELKELVASLAIDQKELTKKMAQTEELFKQTEEQMKRTDEKLERIGIHLGNITQNQGDVAEEFFFNSLVKDTHLGSIHFDDVMQNMKKHSRKIQEEYDLVLTNGNAVGIVEVKYKAHKNDLDKLDRKMKNFKKLFPWFEGYKIYGGLAAFNMNEAAKKEALERGFFVLQRYGDILHTECGQNLKTL